MNIDKLIEEKTECFTGNGDYYFTYVTPEDCKKIIEEVLKQGELLPIGSVVGQSEQLICPNCSNPHLYLKADNPKIKHCPSCSRTWAD